MEKDLHLSGIGNALVDVEFRVGNEELEKLSLQKGTMSLADMERQREVLEHFSSHEHHLCSGGSAANTVIAFAQFGGKASYSAMLGNDDYGRFYASEFSELGIELNAPLVEDRHTGTCIVMITPDAERTLHTSLGANVEFGEKNISEDIIRRSEWIYFEGYKFTEDSGTAAVQRALHYAEKHNTLIAVSFSDSFVVNVFRNNLENAAQAADLIFCNEMEANAWTGLDNAEKSFEEISRQFANVVVTMGAKGSKIQWQGQVVKIPSYKANPVDTTGAGDMFAAGFLYGITHGYPVEYAGHLASSAAAKIVSQYGARLNEAHDAVRDAILMKKIHELVEE